MAQINEKVVIVGICGIVVLEGIALIMGIDEIILTMAIGLIATAIGVAVKRPTFLGGNQ